MTKAVRTLKAALRKVLPAGACEGTENVRFMKLTLDGYGAVFDVSEAILAQLRPTLDAPKNDWLKPCEGELPPLLAVSAVRMARSSAA